MNLIHLNRKSIRFRVTALIMIIIMVQASLLSIFLIIGGVLEQAKINAFTSFSDKVTNRRDYLQREMNFNWTNMDPYVEQISSQFSQSEEADHYFEEISGFMISMLRTTQATGVFVILEEDGDNTTKPALYIRDYDPHMNNYGNKDLYLIYGPSGLASQLQIPLDQRWKYHMDVRSITSDFYHAPLSKAALSDNGNLLGYWSPPFRLYPDDISIITYTMPIYNNKDEAIGIIGVEISEQELSKYLPSTDLEIQDSYGYFIAYQEEGTTQLKPIIVTKAIQKRLFKNQEYISYTNVNSKTGIARLRNENSKAEIYLSMDQLGLYETNTPFQGNRWYLIGMMSETRLFSYVQRIQNILWGSAFASVAIGLLVGYIISYRFTKPITALARKVKESGKNKRLELEETGLTEVDELSGAIQNANNSLLESALKLSRIIELVGLPIGAFEYSKNRNFVFVTDQLHTVLGMREDEMTQLSSNQEAFIGKLDDILSYPDEEEEDIYILEEDSKRWLKIKYIHNNQSTTGVVIDVTEDMIVKKQILQDRDIDNLTGIFSRKAMQDHIEELLIKRNTKLTAAILMFDLDNLKAINDTYGHKWGDIYIRHAVLYLTKLSEDRMILGRRSGDEFTMLLYDFESRDEIIGRIASFFTTLSHDLLILPDALTKQVSLSAGLVWVEGEYTYDEYLQMADEALYCAKKNQKGTCYEYATMQPL